MSTLPPPPPPPSDGQGGAQQGSVPPPPPAPASAPADVPAPPENDAAEPTTAAETLEEAIKNDGPEILATPESTGKDGVNRCTRCGASEVSYNDQTETFKCLFCRFEWSERSLDEQMGLSTGIESLAGKVISTAAQDIETDEALVTLKCTGCGAEVIVNTDDSLHSKCHWCKHVLSLNNRIPNGAVPDGILPFTVTKAQAMASIQAFVDDRKMFASPAFAASFTAENVRGVYLPYMTVDGNISARLDGQGEVLTKKVRRDDETIYYGDRYAVTRHLDVLVDDLVVETSESKANLNSPVSTNNIVNSILPFDVKEMVRFNANYLTGYTSERRDMNIDAAEKYAANHFATIARGMVGPSVMKYNRGVRWESEHVWIHGSRWVSVLLPVWLYGYEEKRGGETITHYLAVNGRTGETMGSVPINRKKLFAVAAGTAAAISVVTWPLAIVALFLGF